MSEPQTAKPAKLIIGVFTPNKKKIDNLALELLSQFGQIDLVSSWMDFNYTSYYEPEMGSPLVRRVFAFKRPIEQGELAAVKIATNQIEQAYSSGGRREVISIPATCCLSDLSWHPEKISVIEYILALGFMPI